MPSANLEFVEGILEYKYIYSDQMAISMKKQLRNSKYINSIFLQ